MAFATFNIKGYQKGLIGIGKHIDRSCKEAKKTGVFENKEEQHLTAEIGFHIDSSKTHLNEEWVNTGGKSLSELVEQRISEGYKLSKSIRSDAVKALGLVMTGSHDRMKEIEANENLFENWKKANWDFACREFGGSENIVRFSIHRDEKTPHIHCVLVPITPDGRLSAKHYRDGTVKLQGYQNRYAEVMSEFGLERGIESSLTDRKHTTSKEYYKSINKIEREAIAETKYINSLNPFHRGKAKEGLEKVQDKIRSLQEENRGLKQEVIYSRNTHKTLIENRIKNDLEKVKREVNLIQHAASMGYVLDKVKSSKIWAVMEKEGDKILIKNSLNQNGHWMYKSLVDDQEKGTIIDFMKKRGFSYQAICGLSSTHLDDHVINDQKSLSYQVQDIYSQQYIAQEAFDKVVEHKRNNYLSCRGIDQITYENYSSVKVGNQAVFALYRDIDSNGNGTICSTISYQFTRQKNSINDYSFNSAQYFQKGLPRGLSVLVDSQVPINHIVVSESPIDALSYKQIHKLPEGTIYVSTCGNLSEGIKKELTNVFCNAKKSGQSLTLAFDNDRSGRKMQKEISELAGAHQVKHKLSIPLQYKDWNEELVSSSGRLEILRKLQKELVTSGQEYELRKQRESGPTVMGMEIAFD